MRKLSLTYRSFCTLTALTVLLSVSIPSGLHARSLADFCTVIMAENHDTSISGQDHCDLTKDHHEVKHDAVSAHDHSDTADCYLGSVCACSIDEAPVKANAIPSLSKMFTGYIPVLAQTLIDTPDPDYPKPSEQVFASLYSPPLFLKNSAFLN